MKRTITLALAAALALAGTASAQSADGYGLSPWWMREPVVASIGYVRTELPANRAAFTASFEAVDSSVAKATERASTDVRALGRALQEIGGDKVRITTNFSVSPLYEQYRDREGNLVDNQRADKVQRYQVSASLQIEVRDTALLQRIYSTVVAARPASTSTISYRLEPENAWRTRLYEESVKDAARRAANAVTASGARLGPVKLIDPTGRACETDVLAAGVSGPPDGVTPTEVDAVVVTGSRIVRQDFEAIAPVTTASRSEQLELTATLAVDQLLTVEPPLQVLNAKACVVYALA